MKKFIFLIASLTFIKNINGQVIDSISIYPDMPTESDSIYLIANVVLPQSNCWLTLDSLSIDSDTLKCFAEYGTGFLDEACLSVDTLKLELLESGNYVLVFIANNSILGAQDFNSDTLHFHVGFPSFVSEELYSSHEKYPYPNPIREMLFFPVDKEKVKSISVFDLDHNLINLEYEILDDMIIADTQNLTSGMYIFRLAMEDVKARYFRIVKE